LWTWLWGKYHVPQNGFLVFVNIYRCRSASGNPQTIENLYSPNKHGRQRTISNTNEIKQL